MIIEITRTVCTYVATNMHMILIVCILYGLRCWKRPHVNFPPGPSGIPFFGVMLQLRKDPEKVIKKWSLNSYGPVMSVPLGNRRFVYLNTYEAVRSAFSKQGAKFSGRPYVHLFHQVSHQYGLAMKNYDEDYKVQRKFGNKILREFGFGQKKMEDIINAEGTHFVEHLKKQIGNPVDIKTDLYNLTANVISGVALGRRFHYDDSTFRKILLCTEKSIGDPEDAMKILFLVVCPITRFLPFFRGANQRFVDNQLNIMALMRGIINEHKSEFDRDNLKDFIDAYLYEQQFGIGKENDKFQDKQLEAYVRDLFFAGTETSSNTISWGILILLHYPEHKKRIEEEIEKVIGLEGTPSMSHRSEMPFTCAFLQELLRFRTLTPGGSPHSTTENATLLDYVIPKGTTVLANIWGVNNDPTLWPNPEHFDPYRHIDDEGKFVYSSKIIPFSLGPRVCLGEHLARMEIYIIIVTILQKFKLEANANSLPSLEPGVNSPVCTPQRYKIVISER